MQSKRSFFNWTLFAKNLSRSWPLWGGVTAVGCLAPLFVLLALLTSEYRYIEAGELAAALYPVIAAFVPAASFAYAVLVAMVVWSYLYNNRSVGFMHTLPIDRTALFLTNTLSGFAMLLIPYAVVGGFVCLIAIGWGFMDFGAVMTAVAAVLLMTILFFGMATCCAMITGNIFAMPVFYLIVNFVAPALDFLLSLLARSFLVGVRSDYTGMVEFLSPLVQIYQKFRFSTAKIGEDAREYVLHGFGTVVIYGLVGLVFFALAWLLYRRRTSECAGDVVAFRWLRPVFRYGVALAFALTAGHALYALIWESLFQEGNYAEAVPMAVCMALTGVVGYYVASMLLEKTLRVFKDSAIPVTVVVVGAAAICLCTSLDVLGLESYVPEMEEIESLYISSSDMMGETPDLTPEDHRELVEKALVLHKVITEHADEIRDMDMDGRSYEAGTIPDEVYQYIWLTYHLKDGSIVERNYSLYLDREKWEQKEGIEGAYQAFFANPQLQLSQVERGADRKMYSTNAYCYEDHRHSSEEDWDLDQQSLYRAVLQDAREGRLYSFDLFDTYYNDNYPVNVEIEYRYPLEHNTYEGYGHDYASFSLRPTMTHTIANLLEQEFITQEELQRWELEMQANYREKYGSEPTEAGYSSAVIGGSDMPATIVVVG